MLAMLYFVFLLALASLSFGEENVVEGSQLKFPDRFYVKGTLYLPYAQLEEPFDAWYDGPMMKSRIDMYGGVTKTFQRGDIGNYGRFFTVDPWSTETFKNHLTCFTMGGGKGHPTKPQSLFPDTKDFKHIGHRAHRGAFVHVYQLVKKDLNRVNTYTLYVDASRKRPLYYKMHGYNNVMHSHYDEYIMEYDQMTSDFSDDVFDSPMKGMSCHPFPGPGYAARILANPMQQYVHPINESHVYHMHKDFMTKHKRKMGTDHQERMTNFKHNLRYIHSMNRKNLTYKLKVNHFADQTPDELKHLTNLKVTPRDQRGEMVEEFKPTLSNEKIAKEKNWRLYGAVTLVKDQAICGSCWSFGVSGTVEGAYFLKTGQLLRLSEQQLVDCSWGFGNNGCYGGEAWRGYKYIMKHGGLSTEENYGHYLAIDGYCHDDKVKKDVNITGYVNIKSGDIQGMKVALFKHGPVAVGMDAGHFGFKFYSHGVYYEPKCKKGVNDLSHLLLAVGYGVHEGEPYWLIKNSWSTHWGNDGYYMISTKDNNCGIVTDASFAKVN